MEIFVNGKAQQVDDGIRVKELLITLGLGETLVAVERNEEIVPRAEHASTQLAPGDAIEIVQFVGGG